MAPDRHFDLAPAGGVIGLFAGEVDAGLDVVLEALDIDRPDLGQAGGGVDDRADLQIGVAGGWRRIGGMLAIEQGGRE
jgi:hypothetical protein